jgi:transcriptional regulator with XRE-family HTH domain
VEIAEKIGILQTLVADYENDRLRLTAEMAVRFALALDVSLDKLLQPKAAKKPAKKTIESLPAHQQTTLLKTIGTFLKGAVR